MKNTSLKDWIFAARPWSFPASSMPALLAFVYVFYISRSQFMHINWHLGVLAILGAIIFHSGGNLISDYFDYKNGVDREDTFGAGMLVNKVFKPKTILYYGLSFLIVGTILGLYLYSQTGLPLLIIGAIGMIGAGFYFQFKSKALGDLLIFIVYGPVISLGTFYTMTLTISWEAAIICFPITFITVDILHANNTRDILSDKRANIKTLAMNLGINKSIVLYKTLLGMAYLSSIVLVVSGIISWITLAVFITLPVALKNIKTMNNANPENPENIADLDVKTAQLQLMYSLSMIISIIISSLF